MSLELSARANLEALNSKRQAPSLGSSVLTQSEFLANTEVEFGDSSEHDISIV